MFFGLILGPFKSHFVLFVPLRGHPLKSFGQNISPPFKVVAYIPGAQDVGHRGNSIPQSAEKTRFPVGSGFQKVRTVTFPAEFTKEGKLKTGFCAVVFVIVIKCVQRHIAFSINEIELFQRFSAFQTSFTNRGLFRFTFLTNNRQFFSTMLAKFTQESGLLTVGTRGIQHQAAIRTAHPSLLDWGPALRTMHWSQWVVPATNRAKIRFRGDICMAIIARVFVTGHTFLLSNLGQVYFFMKEYSSGLSLKIVCSPIFGPV
jgi:hypothetical protein